MDRLLLRFDILSQLIREGGVCVNEKEHEKDYMSFMYVVKHPGISPEIHIQAVINEIYPDFLTI
jgi:hypothetical protein